VPKVVVTLTRHRARQGKDFKTAIHGLHGPVTATVSFLTIMTELPKTACATKSGKEWLTLALDPFHDYNIPIAGMPDRTHIPTAVQFVKRKVSISAPQGLIGTQTWDCHIFSLPFLSTLVTKPSDEQPYVICAPTQVSNPLVSGTINVVKSKTGNTTFPVTTAAQWEDQTTSISAYSPTDDNKKSQIRLIGGGFEVHNDTAELYKNGSVTCYSSTNDWSDPSPALVGDGINRETYGVAMKARYPPISSQEAALYTDAHTWSAKDGAYVPLRLDLDCPYTKFRPRSQCVPVLQHKEDGLPSSITAKVVAVTDILTAGGNQEFGFVGTESGSNGWLPAPIETTGAFFSGLSPETVLTLDIRFICELAPTAANPAMLTMCSPSAEYDPQALNCYTHCLLSLPPGVPVGMNEKGDFWRMAVKTAKKGMAVASPLINMMGPEAGAIALLADAGLSVADTALNKKGKKKAPQKIVVKPMTKAPRSSGANNTYRK